jgi:hypothetical protein
MRFKGKSQQDASPASITSYAIRSFVDDLPPIRVVKVQADGTVLGTGIYAAHHFGGAVPNTGDTIGMIWGDGDYELQSVQRRYFFDEWKSDSPYWVVVVRDADPSPQFDAICTHALLQTDLYRAIDAKAPVKEVAARTCQLEGQPTPGVRRYKPKERKPDE